VGRYLWRNGAVVANGAIDGAIGRVILRFVAIKARRVNSSMRAALGQSWAGKNE